MTRRVLVWLVLIGMICTSTALAHPFVIRPDAVRPTDNQIDTFLENHPSDEWNVYGIQYYADVQEEWWFVVVAFPEEIEGPLEIVEGSTRTWIHMGVGAGGGYGWDYRDVSVTRSGLSSEWILKHRNSAGDYSISPPMNPLQMAMEGAVTTMTQPIRQIFPTVMIIAVGLVGFAKGWMLLRRLLLRA